MFKIIIQLTILIYIIFVVYNLINLQKFNINGVIIETYDINDIKINSDLLNPVLTNDNNIDFDINNINGYSQILIIIKMIIQTMFPKIKTYLKN